MEFKDEVEASFGFCNEPLAEKLSKITLTGLSDEYICKIGIVCGLSNDEEIREQAKRALNLLKKNHDRSGPFMLLKWVIRVREGASGLEEQLEEWKNNHPDQIVYSRVILALSEKDPIALIGAYVKHLELFWNDEGAWEQLGRLYMKEKLYDRAAFCFEEAISLLPNKASNYLEAAKANIKLDHSDYARKQLSKCIVLDPKNMEAVDLLIDLKGPNTEKLIRYKELCTV